MLVSSTPDALWSSPSLRLLRPSAVVCSRLRRGSALDGCTLSVPVGGRLLLVGEPATSASTLLRVLGGLVRPAGGSIRIAGLTDPSAEGWGRRVAYVGPEPGIHRWMTPREALELAARLLDLGPEEASARIERVAAWCRLPRDAMDRPVRRGGSPLIERTAFAAALLGDPEVLLLDEPLRAVEARERTRLLRLPGRRRTILLASRYPASEAGLVTHVALLRRGRVARITSLGELEAAGLPLSLAGVAALADRPSSGTQAGAPAPS